MIYAVFAMLNWHLTAFPGTPGVQNGSVRMKILIVTLCLAASACTQTSNDAAPDAGTQGMEHESPTGASGLSTGTSNVLNHGR